MDDMQSPEFFLKSGNPAKNVVDSTFGSNLSFTSLKKTVHILTFAFYGKESICEHFRCYN